MWQKSGSCERLNFKQAEAYVQGLNCREIAGYSDWRMPTVDELKSLITKDKQANGIFIDPSFDSKQESCWSSSRHADDILYGWGVNFSYGDDNYYYKSGIYYVRAVRNV